MLAGWIGGPLLVAIGLTSVLHAKTINKLGIRGYRKIGLNKLARLLEKHDRRFLWWTRLCGIWAGLMGLLVLIVMMAG